MPSFDISGHLIAKLARVDGQSQKGPWSKQEFVIQTLDKDHPKTICFCAWGDTIEKLRPFKKNDVIKLSFSAESREYNSRYYTELRAFKIESGETLTPVDPTPRQNNPAPAKQVYQEDVWDQSDSTDLPF